MTDVSDRIKALEREMQIASLSPWKVVAGFVGVTGLIIVGFTWWFKPSVIKDHEGKVCNKKLIQYCIAVSVGLASIAWLLWSWYQG